MLRILQETVKRIFGESGKRKIVCTTTHQEQNNGNTTKFFY